MDHHHNVDVKTATKVRFQEPGIPQPNGIEDNQEKVLQETETNTKTNGAAEESQDATDENTEKSQEEVKLLGGSPKQDNKENAEKEAKESQEKKVEDPEEKEPLQITP